MYIPEHLFFVASSGAVQAIKAVLPLLILAFYAITLEILLNKFDKTFSQSWWFFFAPIILIVSDLTWGSWTASTPMADIIIYGEDASKLIFSVFAFLFVVSLLLIWMVISGMKQIIIEAGGSGWGWALLRLSPLVPLVWSAIRLLSQGNAAIGDSGFIHLIQM